MAFRNGGVIAGAEELAHGNRLRSDTMPRTSRLISWSAMFFATVLSLAATDQARGQAGELRYQGNPDQQFAYEFDISVDLPDKIISYKGKTFYTVNSSNANQLNLTYR